MIFRQGCWDMYLMQNCHICIHKLCYRYNPTWCQCAPKTAKNIGNCNYNNMNDGHVFLLFQLAPYSNNCQILCYYSVSRKHHCTFSLLYASLEPFYVRPLYRVFNDARNEAIIINAWHGFLLPSNAHCCSCNWRLRQSLWRNESN